LKTCLEWLSYYDLVNKEPVLCNTWFISWKFPVSNAAEAWSLPQHPSSNEVKNEWSHNSSNLISLHGADRKIHFFFLILSFFGIISLRIYCLFFKNKTRFISNIRAELSFWVRMTCSDILYFHKSISFVSRFKGLILAHFSVNLHYQPFPSRVA